MNNHNLALNPFKKGKKAEVEAVKKVEINKDPDLEYLFNYYKSLNGLREYISPDYIPTLTPKQITKLTDYIILGGHLNEYETNLEFSFIGELHCQLVQKSFDSGYNNFILNTWIDDSYESLSTIGSSLKGKENNYLRLLVNGAISNDCGRNSKYLDMIVDGRVLGFFGNRSKFSNFLVKGDLDIACGDMAENCYFDINGSLENCCGYQSKNCVFYFNDLIHIEECPIREAEYSHFHIKGDIPLLPGQDSKGCSFIIHGDIEDMDYASMTDTIRDKEIIRPDWDMYNNSIYKSSNKKTYEKLCKRLNDSNIVYLIDEIGKVLERR